VFRLAIVAGKGRGLLADRAIPAGTCLERAPAVRLPAQDRVLIDRTAFFPYTFADPQTFGRTEHACLVAFGSLTFCNHSESPNAVVRWTDDAVGPWASLEAIQDISKNEEITVFYTNISEYSSAAMFV
jgi:hypothetical protein